MSRAGFRVRERWVIAALVALSVSKGLVWIAALPLWKIADEPAHFDHVQYRAEHGQRAPLHLGAPIDRVLSPTASPEVRLSWAATQRYHRHLHPRGRTVKEEEVLERIGATFDSRRTNGQSTALYYPSFYYTLATVPYLAFHHDSILDRVFAIRCLSMLLGVIAVLATYFAARRTLASQPLAFAAACVVALQPMFSQQMSAVNNDAAVIAMAALAFYLQIRIVSNLPAAPKIVEGVALGLVVGLATLSKPQGQAVIALSGLLFAWAVVESRHRRAALIAAAAAGVTFLVAVKFPALVGSFRTVPPDVKGSAVSLPAAEIGMLTMLWDFPAWADALDPTFRDYLFRSSWGQFSWLEFSIGSNWLIVIRRFESVWLLGLLAAAVQYVMAPGAWRGWWSERPAIWSTLAAVGGFVAILFAEYYLRVTHGTPGVIQGRNLLYALPPFAVLVALGFGSLVPARLRTISAALLVLLAVIINLASLVCVVRQHHGG